MSVFKRQTLENKLLTPDFFNVIAGHKIAFYESSSKGPTILFVHGNSCNGSYFKHQLQSSLAEKYHCITFDFPGHGNSPKSDEPEQCYGVNGFAGILEAILQSFSIPVWVVSHSMGSNICLYAAARNSKNIQGIFISGLAVIDKPGDTAEAFLPNPVTPLIFKDNLTKGEIENIVYEEFKNKKDEYLSFLEFAVEKTDPIVRKVYGQEISNPEFYYGNKEYLKKCTIPVSITDGSDDAFISKDYLRKQKIPNLWKNKFHVIKNSGHCVHLENPDDINVMIDLFVSENTAVY